MDNATRWVGIDLHRRRSFVTAIDEQGEVSLRRRIVNDPQAFLELLGDPQGTHIALEATYGWEWLAVRTTGPFSATMIVCSSWAASE